MSGTPNAKAWAIPARTGEGWSAGFVRRILDRMDYEYAPLRLPSNVDRLTAAAQLAIQAEFSGWELARVQLFRDGTRKVMLRRRVQPNLQPGLSI
jgi:uncharacterized protein DUF5703